MADASDTLAGTTGVAAPDNPVPLNQPNMLPDQPSVPVSGNTPTLPVLSTPSAPVGDDPNTPQTVPYVTPPVGPEFERQYKESRWHHILDRVGTILGGGETIHYHKDADGNVTISHDPSTTGEKWARVAAAAVAGAGAGLANSQGPGGLARAASAGIQTGMQMPQQREQQAEQQADFQNKQMLAKANYIHVKQQAYLLGVQGGLENLKYNQATAEMLQQNLNALGSDPEAQELGVVDPKDPNSLMELARKTPNFSALIAGNGDREATVTPTPDGKLQVYSHPKAWLDGKIDKPMPWYGNVQDGKGNWSVKQTDTVPAGRMTRRDYQTGTLKTLTDAANFEKNMATANKPPAEKNPTLATFADIAADPNRTPAERAQARRSIDLMKEKTGTGTGGEGGTGGGEGFNPQATNQQHAQMMVDGLEAPSQVSKRAKDYNQIIPLAQAYSWQKYGEPFDAEISESRYSARKDVLKEFAGGKPADQIQSFQAFTNHAQNLMNDVATFRTGNIKLINTAMNALKKQNDPTIGPLIAHISALRREYQNFLSNNMALKGDEIREGKEIMDENSTPAQIESAAKAFMETAIGRVSALDQRARRFNVPVGDILTPANRQTITNMGLGDYANQMIPPAQQQQHMFTGGAGTGTAPPGAGGGGAAAPPLDQSNPPPMSKLPMGHDTTFANGQVWRNVDGKPLRIK